MQRKLSTAVVKISNENTGRLRILCKTKHCPYSGLFNTPFTLMRFKPRFSAVLQIVLWFVGGRLRLSCRMSRKVYVLSAINTAPSRSWRHICSFGCRTTRCTKTTFSTACSFFACNRQAHSLSFKEVNFRRPKLDKIDSSWSPELEAASLPVFVCRF